MKTAVCILAITLGLLFACKPTPKQEKTTPVTPTQTVVDTGKVVPQAWQRLTSMVGEYMYDSVLFKLPAVRDSLKNLLGQEYTAMVSGWNVASELKRTNNILCATGCQHDACFKNMWILLVDIAHSNMNVYHMQDGKMTIYKNRELINLPEGLDKYITTLKKNSKVTENNIVVK
ncbi:MAG: hypothetical protein ACRCSQ_07260 [Bacteroidales bacterium]